MNGNINGQQQKKQMRKNKYKTNITILQYLKKD